jgi:hypothetical protein
VCECDCGAYSWCGQPACTEGECPACRKARIEEEMDLLSASAIAELPVADDPRRI